MQSILMRSMCSLLVYPHRAGLENMPDYGGNRTYEGGRGDLSVGSIQKLRFISRLNSN